MAIRHYADHGQMALLQKFLDAMPANFTRKQAFVKWVVAHAPLKLEKRQFVTDRSANASVLNLDGALAKPFWEFAPEKATANFSAADFLKALNSTNARFETRPGVDLALVGKAKEAVLRLAVDNTQPSENVPPAHVHAAAEHEAKIEAQVQAATAKLVTTKLIPAAKRAA